MSSQFRHFRGAPQNVYRAQLLALLRQGEDVTVKGRQTKEFLNAVTEVPDPRRRVEIVPGRNWNPFLALSESLWLLAGRNDVAALVPYNHRITDYSDDGKTLYGAYGYRLRFWLPKLIAKLQADPATRQAVIPIWWATDLVAQSLDIPCNDMIMFKIRDGKLHMTVLNRSNDAHFGLHAVNLCQFSVLQEYLAARLGVELGTQAHVSNSLHLYVDGPQAAITQRMLDRIADPLPDLPAPTKLFPTVLPEHKAFVMECSWVLDGKLSHSVVPFLEFSADFLLCYREKNSLGASVYAEIDRCRHAENFQDWITSGIAFLRSLRSPAPSR